MNNADATDYSLGQLNARQTESLLESFQRMGYYNPNPGELEKGLMDVCLKTFQRGDVLMRAGESAHSFYIIHKGSVAVSRQINGKDQRIARLGVYDVLGEMALVENRPRSATLTVLEDSELFQLSRWDFNFLMETCEVFRQVIETLVAERKRFNTQLQGD